MTLSSDRPFWQATDPLHPPIPTMVVGHLPWRTHSPPQLGLAKRQP